MAANLAGQEIRELSMTRDRAAAAGIGQVDVTTVLGALVERAITDAQSKAAGIFPVDLGRILLTAAHDDWAVVRWIEAPEPVQYLGDLHRLGERLLLGSAAG